MANALAKTFTNALRQSPKETDQRLVVYAVPKMGLVSDGRECDETEIEQALRRVIREHAAEIVAILALETAKP